MRLLRALCLILCIARASAQTCAVGQVVVNSVCTYNDPSLAIWYKFDLTNKNKNYGTLGDSRVKIEPAACCASQTSSKKGTGSRINEEVLQINFYDSQGQIGLVDSNFGGVLQVMTMSFWLYFSQLPSYDTDPNFGSHGSLFFKINEFPYFMLLRIRGKDSGNELGFVSVQCYNHQTYQWDTVETLGPLFVNGNLNQWKHVVFVFNYGILRMYVDGVQVGTSSNCPVWYWGEVSKNSVNIGGYDHTFSPQLKTILVDDFRMYKRALTVSEVNWLYKPCVSEAPFYDDTYICPCGAGYATVNSVYVPCAAGQYAATGATACTNCVAGTYSRATSSICTNCTVGTSSSSGASVCTCVAVGQVVVNGLYTYNDPALKYWYKFEPSDPKKNWGSGSEGQLSLNGSPSSPLVLSSVAKHGTSSLFCETYNGLSSSHMSDTNKYSLSFWFFFDTNYVSSNGNIVVYGNGNVFSFFTRNSDQNFA
jgi:hypothetical protein